MVTERLEPADHEEKPEVSLPAILLFSLKDYAYLKNNNKNNIAAMLNV